MNFLAPLFLVGALAIAAPIIFHLIRRISREKMTFSSLMFLQPTPPRVTRRSRLENLWLLLLRCLVLCLLALGFARPFLQRPVADTAFQGRGKKQALLIDASASMRRENLWSDARAKAEEYLRRASPADVVAVFTFDTSLHPLVSFEQWSAMGLAERSALAAKKLAEARPGWSATHFGNALLAAVEALEEARNREHQTPVPGQIVLITDLQEGGRLDGLQGYEWPRGVEVIVEPLKARRPTNAGLQLVTERDNAGNATNLAGLRIRVSNSSTARREQFRVGWVRAGENNFLGAPVDLYVPPGQSQISSAPKMPPDAAAEQMVLRGDDDDFDNTVYWAPPRAKAINLLYLGEDSEKDSTQPLYFLQRAFQPASQRSVQINIRALGTAPASSDTNNAPLVIVTSPLAEEQSAFLKRSVTEGKSVLLMMRTAAAAQTIADLAGLGRVSATEASAGGYAMLGQIDFEHPIFAPFAEARFSDFTKIHFWKHRRLEADQIPGARVVARFDNGDPAFVQVPVGKGNLFVLTSGWHPADSQLALSSKFVPLLFSILEQSGRISVPASQFVVGEAVMMEDWANATGERPMTVRKPDGAQVELPAGDKKFSQTDQVGIYTVTSAQPPFRFAVNLAAEESRTAPMPIEELQRLRVPLKQELIQTAKREEARRQRLQAEELERRQKLWRWLLVSALAMLLLESWLAGWATRRAGAQAGGDRGDLVKAGEQT
jgi:hypothetical protein